MDLSEFGWHAVSAPDLSNAGLHLRSGGADGELFACVAGMESKPWIAVVGLHVADAVPIRMRCASEAEAIERVDEWLADLLAR